MLVLRYVAGQSMAPALLSGQLVVGWTQVEKLEPGQVVIVRHQGKDKIKRIQKYDPVGQKVFVVGDNKAKSTDSRHFGWLSVHVIIARVIWPRV